MKSDIIWNVQGAANPNFHKLMKEYLHDFDPDLEVLVETKLSGVQANRVVKSIGMPKSHKVEAKGFSCGI